MTPDGKTWTFTIRKGDTWSDGVPLTASDVAFTYNYIIKNNLTNWTTYTQGIKQAVAVNDTTVRIECSQPKADMLSVYVPIVPEHVWSKISGKAAASSYPNTPPYVSSGPFKCVEWKKSSYVKLVANDQYWRGRPHIDTLLFDYYTNADTMVQDLKAGTIDGCNSILDAQYRELKGQPGIEARTIRTNGFDELAFNCYTLGPSKGNPVLKDVKFRQALNWAVDKDRICALAYGGHATPATTVMTADYYKDPDWHWQPPADVKYSFDIAKAGQLLDAAGYPLKNGVRIDKQGKPITLRLWSRTDSMTSQNVGRLMTGWFRRLGLKITLQTMDDGTLEQRHLQQDRRQARPRLRHVPLGLVQRPRPGLDPVVLHHGADRQPERLRLLEPAVRPALQQAGAHDRPHGAQGDHRRDAADPLPGLALHRHRLFERPRGLQHRQVDRLRGLTGGHR